MDIETTLLLRKAEKIERGLQLLENTIHEIRWDMWKIKNPCHLLDEAIMEMEEERDHESIRF